MALSTPQLKEHDSEHQIGPMRRFASTAIRVVERLQVEVSHGISNFPCEMIMGQLLVKLAPKGRVFSPGRLGKTNRYLGIAGRDAYHRYGLLVGVAEW
jgi:hypothetical protein